MLLDVMGQPLENPGEGSGICVAARLSLAAGPRFIPTCANGYQVSGGPCDVPFTTTDRFRLCEVPLACSATSRQCEATCSPLVDACAGAAICQPAFSDAPLALTHGFCAP